MPTPIRFHVAAAITGESRPAAGLAGSALLHAGVLATILWATAPPEIIAGAETAPVYEVLMADAPPGPETPAPEAPAVEAPAPESVVEAAPEAPAPEAPAPEAPVEAVVEPPPPETPVAEAPPPEPLIVAEAPLEPVIQPEPPPPAQSPPPPPLAAPPPAPPKPAVKREAAPKPPRPVAAASPRVSPSPNGAAGGGAASGGAVNAVSYAAEPLRQPAPKYPAAAQRRGLEGKVVLRVRVGPGGEVEGVEVLTGSGAEILDEAAIQAVRGWTFRPAMRLGAAVAAVVDVPVRFRLDEQR